MIRCLLFLLALCPFIFTPAGGQEVEFEQSMQALQEGDLATAEKLAREALALSGPENLSAMRNLLGMVLGQAGRYGESIALFRQNAEADPADAGAFANWAQALRRAGRPAEAIPQLEKAMALRPDSALYALQLRLARIESGEDEAIGQATMLELQRPLPPADWLLTGVAIALQREKWEEARLLLGQARATMQPRILAEILQDPAFSRYADRPEMEGVFPRLEIREAPGPITLEAVQAYQNKHFEEALRKLRQAEDAGEPAGPIFTMRGGVWMEHGKFAEAAESFEKALQLSPGDVSLHLNYGESLRASGQYDEASQVFQRGLRLDPGNELLGLKLAFALVEAGQGSEVLEAGLREAQAGPLLIGKAAAAASQGKMAEAADWLQAARDGLPPEVFTSILRDPVFRPYRNEPALARFFRGIF